MTVRFALPLRVVDGTVQAHGGWVKAKFIPIIEMVREESRPLPPGAKVFTPGFLLFLALLVVAAVLAAKDAQ